MQLGQTIVKLRKDNGLTQEDFANKYNVTRQTVSNWENEKSYPDLLTLVKISDDFGISLDTMLKENPNMTEEMNKDINLAKALTKMYEKGVIIAIIGAIACCAMIVISLVDYDGIVEPIVWLIALLININAISACVQIRRKKRV